MLPPEEADHQNGPGQLAKEWGSAGSSLQQERVGQGHALGTRKGKLNLKGGGGVRPGVEHFGAWLAARYEELSPAPPEAITDRSETHPLTNLERHGQRRYQVTRNCTEGEGRNMPVRNAGKWGGEGGTTRGQLAFGQLCQKTLKNLRRQQQTGPFYGLRHLWQRVEFWGRDCASGQRHRVMQVQALGARLPDSGPAQPQQ